MIDHAAALVTLAAALGEPLSGEARDRLARFCDVVAAWEPRVDLTGAKTAPQRIEILAADALVLAREALVPHGARVVDVGSGVGAPVLPLLLLRDDLRATLVEPRRKRVTFLRTAVGSSPELVGRATVVEDRIELARPAAPGMPFDVAMARATFAPGEWLPAGLALARRVLVLTATEELETPAGTVRVAAHDYVLPRTGARRRVAAYERDR